MGPASPAQGSECSFMTASVSGGPWNSGGRSWPTESQAFATQSGVLSSTCPHLLPRQGLSPSPGITTSSPASFLSSPLPVTVAFIWDLAKWREKKKKEGKKETESNGGCWKLSLSADTVAYCVAASLVIPDTWPSTEFDAQVLLQVSKSEVLSVLWIMCV